MKKLTKKALALTLCASMVFGSAFTGANADAKKKSKKVTISKTKLTLSVDQSKKLTLKKGKKTLKCKTWSSSDSTVATVGKKTGKVTGVSEGSAVIKAKFKGKVYKCKVTVKSDATPSPSATPSTKPGVSASPTVRPSGSPGTSTRPTTRPSSNPTTDPSDNPTPTPGIEDNGFNYEDDVTYVDNAKNVRVEFQINKDVVSEEELIELGYDVTDGVASKDTICEVREYTFQKLPNTLRGLQTIPLTGEYSFEDPIDGYEYEEDGIGFNTMMASACVAATFRGYSNPSDPMGDKDPMVQECRKMFEYLNGPREANNIANARWQTCVQSMKDATTVHPNVYLSYFGAKSDLFYEDPGEGNYKLTVYRGPYMIPEKETITGKRPATYMMFIGNGDEQNDWGTDRYIDVWKSSDGNWYSWDDNYLHVTANNFRTPEEGF